MQESGNLRLVDSKRCGNLRLREAAPLDDAAGGGSEAGFGIEFDGVGKAHIGENVAAAGMILSMFCSAISLLG